jgi:tetratricopeptide (TPR) repeat protein
VWAPLLAYAYWLEQQVQLAESLDVLDTALAIGDAGALAEKIATHLQRGRVLRLSGRFPESLGAYATAGEMANLSGDWRSEMVSRIGRAEVLQKTGDLPRAEAEMRAVLQAAEQRDDAFIESRASHGLAVSAHLMERPAEAAALMFRAFELYEEPTQRIRALHDTGVFLKELGHYSAARAAFLHVLDSGPWEEARFWSMLSLFDVAWLVGDRVGFERWKRELAAVHDRLLPVQQIEYHMSAGRAMVGAGDAASGIESFRRALGIAEKYKLAQQVFAAERAAEDARAGQVQAHTAPVVEEEPDSALRETVSGVLALRAGAG